MKSQRNKGQTTVDHRLPKFTFLSGPRSKDMPTYEYECDECHHHFEKFQRITDEPVKTCPVCGGKVKKLISGGGGLLFKGNGFYITDHRSASYRKKEREEKGLPLKKDDKKEPTAKKTE
jgi:putative FmdB family regulatory protein